MTTLLPKDADNNTIPALRLRKNGAHSIAVGATSARNTTAFNDSTKVISLYASVPVYLNFGDSSVTATGSDHYFPSGVYYDIALSGGAGKGSHHDYVAVLRAEEDGTVYISEKE
jgi:hypothetical protein